MLFILAVVHGAIRRQDEKLAFADTITAGELLRALEVQRAINATGSGPERVPTAAAEAPDEERQEQDVPPEERPAGEPEPNNITSLEARSRRDRSHEDW